MGTLRGVAFIFPGQGAQYVGMGQDIAEKYGSAKKIYQKASAALGLDMEKMIFGSDEQTLMITENTQPALLTTCIASMQPLLDAGIMPEVSAGLSVGEYSAHVTAGTLCFNDAVLAVKKRGKFMQEEVPVGQGGMAAIMGLSAESVENCCQEIIAQYPGSVVEPVNFNCPGQIVIAGNIKEVEAAAELCRKNGAKRAMMLSVSAPFHSSLMRGAGEKLDKSLEEISFYEMKIPVVSNVTAEYIENAAEVRESLVRQVSTSVKWEQCVHTMIKKGIDTFIEIGPGKTLAGFIKKISKDVTVYSVNDVESLEAVLNTLHSQPLPGSFMELSGHL